MTLRLKCYQQLNRFLLPRLGPHLMKERWDQSEWQWKIPPSIPGPCLWFHASSVGELETLWPLIEAYDDQGLPLVMTVFSSSAAPLLAQRSSALKNRVYCGFSPVEGQWQEALQAVKPRFFITAKYEAWPELWAALTLLHVPLVIVGARARSSLKLGKYSSQVLVGGLPPLRLMTYSASEEADLRKLFPKAFIRSTGDPRWKRISQRQSQAAHHPRLQQILKKIGKDTDRPWGILGSVWPEDRRLWKDVLAEVAGLLWIVPHKISESDMEAWQNCLIAAGRGPVYRSSHEVWPGQKPRAIIVDEMGILPELYSLMDYAYVGGGLGQGLHSTMEPAFQGLFISGGRKAAQGFSEVPWLQEPGQLELLESPKELSAWLQGLEKGLSQRQVWRDRCHSQQGAVEQILNALQDLTGSKSV